MNNISPGDLDDNVINWASALDEKIELLRETLEYAEVWVDYQKIVEDEICEKGNRYKTEILTAQDQLFNLLPFQSSSIQITTVLNPLQADPLTDVVSINNFHYIVTSHLRPNSFIHELIHITINPYLNIWKDHLSKSKHLLDPVYDRMEYLSYAWDHSSVSWQNVFSETLVRVLTALVSENENMESRESQIEDLVQQGFAYARPIAETITNAKKINPLSYEWLENCLQVCSTIMEEPRKNL